MPLLLPFSFLEPVVSMMLSDLSMGFRGIDSCVALARPETRGVFALMSLFLLESLDMHDYHIFFMRFTIDSEVCG